MSFPFEALSLSHRELGLVVAVVDGERFEVAPENGDQLPVKKEAVG